MSGQRNPKEVLMNPSKSSSWFTRFTKASAHAAGRPTAFISAVLVIATWAITGPVFNWSDTWQLVINTGTTIVTFLMVFLIQSTQNRDSVAVQVKLDELLRVSTGAHNVLLDLEELDESELNRIREVYERLAAEARRGVDAGRSDEGVPPIGHLMGDAIRQSDARGSRA
jgi:low affinity Fe/Cu permease